MTLTPYVVLWSLLGVAVLALALYRKLTTLHSEGDIVHLADSEAKLIPQQVAMARKLHAVDRWGETLTVLTVLAGLVIASVYLYNAWQQGMTR